MGMGEDKEKLKFDALLREYIEIRHEFRTFEVLQIVCVSLSVLTFIVMLIGYCVFQPIHSAFHFTVGLNFFYPFGNGNAGV